MTSSSSERSSRDHDQRLKSRFAAAVDGGRGDSELVLQAVDLAKRGDMDALHFLYARYAADVLGYVRSFVKDHHEAEDITQNVFAKLMSAIQKYEQREVPFAAWILRVARNAALDHMRTRRAVPCEEVRTSDDGHHEIGAERCRSLQLAFDQLPADQREVAMLRHIVGLSPTEIASVLGKTESSVHGLHHRGRGTLQAALRSLDAAPVTQA